MKIGIFHTEHLNAILLSVGSYCLIERVIYELLLNELKMNVVPCQVNNDISKDMHILLYYVSYNKSSYLKQSFVPHPWVSWMGMF